MLTFTTSLALLLTTVTASNPGMMLQSNAVGNSHIVLAASNNVLSTSTEIAAPKVVIDEKGTVESYVRSYFEKAPVLAEIAYCESKFKHYKKDGSVTRGILTPEDVGVMQINEFFHGETAEKLGLNLEALEDNLKYAMYLYEKKGTQPWSASAHCWNK